MRRLGVEGLRDEEDEQRSAERLGGASGCGVCDQRTGELRAGGDGGAGLVWESG